MHSSIHSPAHIKRTTKMSSSQAHAPQFYISPAVQHLSIHLDTFLYQNSNIDRLAVGALIFHPNPAAANSPRLLLLQRSNSSRVFPNIWEFPGGRSMTEDETILQSLVRKVAEETRMRVNHIFRRVQEIVYLTVRGVRWAKLCFLVGVDEVTGQEPIQNVPVRIVRSSHRAARWASRNEIEELEVMTEGQRGVMRSGFDAFAEWCAEGNRELGERLVLLYL